MDEAAALKAAQVAFRKRLNDASDSMLRDEQRQALFEERSREEARQLFMTQIKRVKRDLKERRVANGEAPVAASPPSPPLMEKIARVKAEMAAMAAEIRRQPLAAQAVPKAEIRPRLQAVPKALLRKAPAFGHSNSYSQVKRPAPGGPPPSSPLQCEAAASPPSPPLREKIEKVKRQLSGGPPPSLPLQREAAAISAKPSFDMVKELERRLREAAEEFAPR